MQAAGIALLVGKVIFIARMNGETQCAARRSVDGRLNRHAYYFSKCVYVCTLCQPAVWGALGGVTTAEQAQVS